MDTKWKTAPITVETWKARCAESSHVRPGEALNFTVSRYDTITCFIAGTSIFLGSYFVKGSKNDGILDGTGWVHS